MLDHVSLGVTNVDRSRHFYDAVLRPLGLRAAVDAFHVAAIASGGRDDGRPGLRPHYHPDYYCAFVLDPDGHRIEAVCHAPTTPIIVPAG